jgi:hypothetical protein
MISEAMKISLGANLGACCMLLLLPALIRTGSGRGLSTANGSAGFVTELPKPTARSVSAQPVAAPPSKRAIGCPVENFAPVLLRDMQRPLADNEVWVVQTVLLNPTEGSLTHPGGWAAPAKLMTGSADWR